MSGIRDGRLADVKSLAFQLRILEITRQQRSLSHIRKIGWRSRGVGANSTQVSRNFLLSIVALRAPGGV